MAAVKFLAENLGTMVLLIVFWLIGWIRGYNAGRRDRRLNTSWDMWARQNNVRENVLTFPNAREKKATAPWWRRFNIRGKNR